MSKKNDSSPQLGGMQRISNVPSLSLRNAQINLLVRAMNERNKRLFAIDCAKRLVPVYLTDYPNDSSVKMLLDEAVSFINSFSSQKALWRATVQLDNRRIGDRFKSKQEIIEYWLKQQGYKDPSTVVAPLVIAAGREQDRPSSSIAAQGILHILEWTLTGVSTSAAYIAISHSSPSPEDEEIWHKPRILEYLTTQKHSR